MQWKRMHFSCVSLENLTMLNAQYMNIIKGAIAIIEWKSVQKTGIKWRSERRKEEKIREKMAKDIYIIDKKQEQCDTSI